MEEQRRLRLATLRRQGSAARRARLGQQFRQRRCRCGVARWQVPRFPLARPKSGSPVITTRQNVPMKRDNTRSRALFVGTRVVLSALALVGRAFIPDTRADETCSSPYLARIEGQEEFVYVWTLGVEGLGDGSDKLVVVDVKPGSPNFGKVISSQSVGGRNEAHHCCFTDDRRQVCLFGLKTSKTFIFDVHSNPAQPKLVKTIDNFAATT